MKKPKLENGAEAPDASKRVLAGARHSDGGMGKYFKQDPHQNGATTAPTTIDLTELLQDDDDDVQITSVVNLEEKEVCYGMIDAKVQAYKIPKPPKSNTTQFTHNQWPSFPVYLERDKERGVTIRCLDAWQVAFGNLDEASSVALAPIMDAFRKLRIKSRIMSRTKKPTDWAHAPCSDRYNLFVILYGRRVDAQKIARWLGQKNTWLRQPIMVDQGCELVNPHAESRSIAMRAVASGHVVSMTRTAEEATDAVSKLFDHQADEANEIKGTEAADLITTELLPHQKQALTFMLQQERPRTFSEDEGGNSSLWRRKRTGRGLCIYEEVVTGLQVKEEPQQVFGGLLADVMGLGKTIEMLALLASTLDDAVRFGEVDFQPRDESESNIKAQSRATLIVAPVSTVKNWEDQINEHVVPGGMRYHVYHGASRQRQWEKLADNDVVITTYGTISAEIASKSGQSPISQIRWFRVVLDEAHTIRESKSQQAKAINMLAAERRWCLTGTPIQNRMEDLASLTMFLRLYPYDSLARFNQYIKAPAQSGDPGFLKSLRVFVDSFTLRRLRDRIDLPRKDDMLVTLQFSQEERRVHDFFKDRFSVAIQKMSRGGQARGKGISYHRVLEGIIVLRLICDHGKELLKEGQIQELNDAEKGTVVQSIDVDEETVLRGISDVDASYHFKLCRDGEIDFCADCQRRISDESPSPDLDRKKDAAVAYVLPCETLYCADCFTPYKKRFDELKNADTGLECPAGHESRHLPQYVAITREYADGLEKGGEDVTAERNSAFRNGFYSGPHTKVRQLLQDIDEMTADSQGLIEQGEAPLKCVIFSEFTSYLDLIERALTDNGYTFGRIDGSMSLAKRRKVMDALNNDSEMTILLASIKAAGQGLNLTAASRAFIMEPMWNPAAEAQAVDRIYRIGQKREVMVKRFRMDNSIENQIVAIQDKKKKLAEMSMEKSAMQKMLSRKEKNEQSLKAMIDIFKN